MLHAPVTDEQMIVALMEQSQSVRPNDLPAIERECAHVRVRIAKNRRAA